MQAPLPVTEQGASTIQNALPDQQSRRKVFIISLFVIVTIAVIIAIIITVLFLNNSENKLNKKTLRSPSQQQPIDLRSEYQNPFDKKASYENPFDNLK